VTGENKQSSGGYLMWDTVISQGQIFGLQAVTNVLRSVRMNVAEHYPPVRGGNYVNRADADERSRL